MTKIIIRTNKTDPNDFCHSYTRIFRTDGKTNPLQCGSKSRLYFAKQKKQVLNRPERKTRVWRYFLDGEEMSLESISDMVNLTHGTLFNMFYPDRHKRRKEKHTIMEINHKGRIISRSKKPKRIFLRDDKPCHLATIRGVFNCLTQEAEDRIKAAGGSITIKKHVYTLLYEDRV